MADTKVNLVLEYDDESGEFRFLVPEDTLLDPDVIEYLGSSYIFDRYSYGVAYYKKAMVQKLDTEFRVPEEV